MANLKRAASLLLCMCIIIALFAGCSDVSQNPNAGEASKMTYTISVKNESGTPLTNIGVRIYTDASKSELVNVGRTNAEGSVTFTDAASDSYVVVLNDVPASYVTEESYSISSADTTITLSVGTLTDELMNSVAYSLGDMVMDFTVTDCEGTEHNLAELLEQKRAVVLNFWFLNCNPCKMEFPYVQEAYAEYSDDVALLAMNPVDGDDAAIASYKSENGLTFPMAGCDPRWQNVMQIGAYPTTVIIDRFGTICLVHGGMFTDSEGLKNALAYFTADDYEQTVFSSIEEIPAI